MTLSSPAASRNILQTLDRDIERLRAMPAAVRRALQMLEDPNVQVRLLSETLSADQVIAAQILRYANSAAFGGIRPCATIAEGLVRIGLRQLKSLLYGVAAAGPLSARLAGYQFGAGQLYQHSMTVAAVARRLSAIVRYRDPEIAYAAGLLHDIGKLPLDRHIRPFFDEIADVVAREQLSPLALEEQYLGIDHATVGGLVGDRWHYPAALTEAIRFHHAPTLAQHDSPLAAIVHLANLLVLQSGVGLTPLGIPPFNEQVLNILNLPADNLGQIAYDMRADITETEEHFQKRYTAPLPASSTGLLDRTSPERRLGSR
jgi:putative nucleotidyltransferase with HDIG domain